MIRIEAPDGSIVEFPDGTPDSVIEVAMRQEYGGAPISTSSDVAKGAGTGLAEGAIGLAGGFGDAAAMNERLFSGAAKYLGAPEMIQNAAGLTGRYLMGPFANAPTSEQIAAPIKQVTGEFYQPQTGAGQFARTAGQIAPGAAVGPGGVIPKIAGWAGATLGSELGGALSGGKWYDPYARAAGAIIGGGTAMKGADIATAPVPQGQTRTSAALLRNATPDDLTPFRKLGPEGMTMDASPSMTGLAQGVAVAPGKQKDAIVSALTDRQGGRSQRLLSDAEQTLGRPHDPEYLKRAVGRAASRKAGPIYGSAKANAPALPPNFEDTLAPGVTNAFERLSLAGRKARIGQFDQLEDALRAGDPQLVAERLHDLRKNVDSMIVYDPRDAAQLSSADKAMQRSLKEFRGEIDDILKNRIPGFDKADEIIAAGKKAQEGVDYGFNALDGGKTASAPKTFNIEARRHPERFVNEGMKSRIASAMGTQANDLAALKKMIGEGTDFNRAKLESRFGPAKVSRLADAVDREGAFSQTFADVARNSQTAQRGAAAKSITEADAPSFSGSETITGLLLKGGAKGVNAAMAKVLSKASQPTRDALAKALMAKGTDAETLMNELRRTAPAKRAAIISALLHGLGASSGSRVGTGQVSAPAGR